MKRILSIFTFAATVFILSGCFEDPNESANKLYVEAYQALQNAKTDVNSFSDLFKEYNKAQIDINRITKRKRVRS
jgi:hypothetical protein